MSERLRKAEIVLIVLAVLLCAACLFLMASDNLFPKRHDGYFEAAYKAQAEGIYLVNINTADESELQTLPGIGSVLAERIVAHRKVVGSFSSADDLLKVEGIGAKTLDSICELITF